MATLVFSGGAMAGIFFLIFFGCSKSDEQPTGPAGITVTDIPITAASGAFKSTGQNRMPNGGGSNTTDWMGTNVGRGWGTYPQDRLTRFAITSCAGDRYQEAWSVSQFCLISPEPARASGVWHRLICRYTATTSFIIVVRYGATCGYRIWNGEVSHEWKTVDTTFWAPRVLSLMYYNRPNEPGGIRVDNVNLY